MRLIRSFSLSPRGRRQLCSGLVLFSYVVTIFGYPLPAAAERKGDQTSAGDSHACHCSAAMKCAGTANCCCLPRKAIRPCCQNTSDQQKPAQPAQSSHHNDVQWELGVVALQCHGLSTLWVSSGAATPPTPPIVWSPFLAPWDWLPEVVCAPDRRPVPPLEPPPRLVFNL
jgi:hypothetical protein